MELKAYQEEVLNDLEKYLTKAYQPQKRLDESFREYWEEKGVYLVENDQYLHPYNNLIKGVPRVTAKVPTAGGKTFIACHALKRIFDGLPFDKPKVVVWFVPSDTILEQTYRNLCNPLHPYRQQLDAHFNASVWVVNKDTALMGQGISPVILPQQLTIFVLGVDSFVEAVRGENKLPKVYRENENLAFAETLSAGKAINIPKADKKSLITFIAKQNPVVIIDESHNFGSDLRVDLLRNINPCFIYELTATPKQTSNIISFVDAMKLKKENMVKLPVIVYNHKSTNDVISSAIALRNNLEKLAAEQKQISGRYVRPIVLFQAQSNTGEDSINFERIKEQLVNVGIPNIITVNALKEGWDCPFAYILASLANKSSRIDVEQVLGRILRQPGTCSFDSRYLNMSYVFTCSSQFKDTIEAILQSLQNAGFSGRDYLKHVDSTDPVSAPTVQQGEFDFLTPPDTLIVRTAQIDDTPEIDSKVIQTQLQIGACQLDSMMRKAEQAEQEYAARTESQSTTPDHLSTEVQEKMKDVTYVMRNPYAADARTLRLPQFMMKVDQSLLFQEDKLLEEEDLLRDFKLTVEDKKIDFSRSQSESQMIDLDERNLGEWVPTAAETPAEIKNDFYRWFSLLNTASKVTHLTTKVSDGLARFNCINQGQIKRYVQAVLEDKDNEELTELAQNLQGTITAFKNKIETLVRAYSKEVFKEMMVTGELYLEERWCLPERLMVPHKSSQISKMLYTEEDKLDTLEDSFIRAVAALPNVVWWHKNLRYPPGFRMNGFVPHYPDFIVQLKSGIVLLIETKGDHLDNSESADKVEQGRYFDRM